MDTEISYGSPVLTYAYHFHSVISPGNFKSCLFTCIGLLSIVFQSLEKIGFDIMIRFTSKVLFYLF